MQLIIKSILIYMIEQISQCKTQRVFEQKQISSIRRVSNLVDSITKQLCSQIINGTISIDISKKLPIRSRNYEVRSEMLRHSQPSIIKHIDPQEHKKKVINFVRANKKAQRNRQLKLSQLQERLRLQKLSLQKSKEQQRNRTIQLRKKQIQKRQEEKKQLMEMIRQSMKQTNISLLQVKARKPLYQKKQEQFRENYLLPKIQEQKRILQKKSQIMRPMDISELITHQQQYSKNKIGNQIHRSLKYQIIQNQKKYSPPTFVPQSYLILTEEEQIKKAQQELKLKQHEINQIKKKKFIDSLHEIRSIEFQKAKTLQNIDNKQAKDNKPIKQAKQSLRIELTSQETKKLGNQYMKQIINKFKKDKIRGRKFSNIEIRNQRSKKSIKSHYELQIIKQQRIQRISKIRVKKIDEIVNSKNISKEQKYQKLQIQAQKLDNLASMKKIGDTLLDRQQSSSILLTSINAKIAMLSLESPS